MTDKSLDKTEGKEKPRRQQLVMALLEHGAMQKAAKSVGISTVTAWRISKTAEFREEYRRACREAFGRAMTALQHASGAAVSTLVSVMEDRKNSPAVRVRAAESVLRHAGENFAAEGLAARLDAMEQQTRKLTEEKAMPKELPPL